MSKPRPNERPYNGFSAAQLRLLSRNLDPAAIRHRQTSDGTQIAYLEGWFAVSEANAIFGYGGWEREIVHFERCFEQRRGDETACGYVARVKLTVTAGARKLAREGTGFGQGRAKTPAEAYERAIKSAETDATKRALSTFGNRFGLGLYGKDGPVAASAKKSSDKPGNSISDDRKRSLFALRAPDGTLIDGELSPEAFCTGLRQLIGKCESAQAILFLAAQNEDVIAKVAALGLKTPTGTLYSDILRKLLKKKEEAFRHTEFGLTIEIVDTVEDRTIVSSTTEADRSFALLETAL